MRTFYESYPALWVNMRVMCIPKGEERDKGAERFLKKNQS